MPNRIISFTDAIKEATRICLESDPRVFVIGLGVDYPNGADGTTGGLANLFPGRVLDTPCSESAVTGLCVGSAVSGLRPILHHGRVEFALFAADQIFTQAAKWNFMFGGSYPCPLVIRIAVGRQWGNGPQHTQVLHSLFGQVPGLKVVIPSTPADAKGLLISAVRDSNPVIYLEHRWLYKLKGEVPEGEYRVPLDRCNLIRQGDQITVVASADTLLESLLAADLLEEMGIGVEVIDLVSLNPVDYGTIIESVKKTKKLLVVDVGTEKFGIGGDLCAKIAGACWEQMDCAPKSLSCPNCPCPTAPGKTEKYYPYARDIVNVVRQMHGLASDFQRPMSFSELHLAPQVNISELMQPSHGQA